MMAISKRISKDELIQMYEFQANILVEAQKRLKKYRDALEYYANENKKRA